MRRTRDAPGRQAGSRLQTLRTTRHCSLTDRCGSTPSRNTSIGSRLVMQAPRARAVERTPRGVAAVPPPPPPPPPAWPRRPGFAGFCCWTSVLPPWLCGSDAAVRRSRLRSSLTSSSSEDCSARVMTSTLLLSFRIRLKPATTDRSTQPGSPAIPDEPCPKCRGNAAARRGTRGGSCGLPHPPGLGSCAGSYRSASWPRSNTPPARRSGCCCRRHRPAAREAWPVLLAALLCSVCCCVAIR